MWLIVILIIIAVILVLKSIVQIDEYERGVKFYQGKFKMLLLKIMYLLELMQLFIIKYLMHLKLF